MGVCQARLNGDAPEIKRNGNAIITVHMHGGKMPKNEMENANHEAFKTQI